MAAAWLSLRAPPALDRWWRIKSARERTIVVVLAAVVGIALLWLLLWQPMQRDIVATRAALTVEHERLAFARRIADEMASLARVPSVPPTTDPKSALDRALTQRALRGAAPQIDWQEGRARVVFATVNFDGLIAALEPLQRESGLRVIEATITATVEPGNVRAELTLAR